MRYGSENWKNKNNKSKILEKIRKEEIRRRMQMKKKYIKIIEENRMSWYGHARRSDEN